MKKITSEIECQQAMKRFYEVFQAKKGTKESEEANELALLIEEYDNEITKPEIFTDEFLNEIGFTLTEKKKGQFLPHATYGKAKDKWV